MAEPEPYEWDFLIYDPQESCSICGEPIRPGQAGGHGGGVSVQAKCARPEPNRE